MDTCPSIVRPTGTEVPVVISVPHAGTEIPDDERDVYTLDVERLHHDGDLYVHELYADAPSVGATLIYTPYSRFVIDPNRLPDDVSPLGVAGGKRKSGPGYYGERGVIWAVTTRSEPIYGEPLSRERFLQRRERYYDPYHAAINRELARLRDTFGTAVFIDAHSMPSRATRLHRDSGSSRPDIVPGDLWGASCAQWLTDTTCGYWESVGRATRLNEPYRGGAIVRLHGRPSDELHAIQVELNRALYMDEASLDRSDGFDRLRDQCTDFVTAVAAAIP